MNEQPLHEPGCGVHREKRMCRKDVIGRRRGYVHPVSPHSFPLGAPFLHSHPWRPHGHHTAVCALQTLQREQDLGFSPKLCNAEQGTDSPRHSRSRLRAGFPPFPGLRSAPGPCHPAAVSKAAVTAPCLGFPPRQNTTFAPGCMQIPPELRVEAAPEGKAASGCCSPEQTPVGVGCCCQNPSVSPDSAGSGAQPGRAQRRTLLHHEALC